MNINICKWKYNAQSPVLFMIDDLANVWVDLTGTGQVDLGEDWGYAKNGKNASIRFLENKILKSFPWVKVNFYVPVGKRIGMLKKSSIFMYSNPINENKETKNFFNALHAHPNYELSYHGLTHGEVFEKAENQKQEWDCYGSLDEAMATIEKGKQIFKDACGEYPKGGKYCGYKAGEFGDQSINDSNFLWWHRYWNKGVENQEKGLDIGNELNPLKNFDLINFGSQKVIDIPSTLNGALFNNTSANKIKLIVKKALSFYFFKKKKEK